jgi:GDPmannose 4,6-dehydratase
MKSALITGASSQDAYHLAKMLLAKDYLVFAVQRRVAREEAETVKTLRQNKRYRVLEGDITDESSIIRAIKDAKPEEFYHLAAQSEVGTSFKEPLSTFNITGLGTAVCLEAIREIKPDTKFYFAGSSEMYGDAHDGKPLNEDSPMIPRSPYAAAKLAGYHLSRIYRKSYNMFVCCGILFNHEGPHRKEYFVTRKITYAVAEIKAGVRKTLDLGDINSGRDWGHSRDYMKAAWMMLQHPEPDDYVVAMGTYNTVRDILDIAFKYVGIKDWTPYVNHNSPAHLRPNDVIRLIGDASKIRGKLGWKPRYTFESLIQEMMYCDMARVEQIQQANKYNPSKMWFDNLPDFSKKS